ncbi:MAG TPA: helix-turn-helix domain-containing protein [Actinomycetes bacterium]|nr:helix-turn-helix domain-containing protein [Actinomycetes bacterium]
MSQETAADYGVGSPTRLGLECLAHKWTPLIVFALKGGPLRFTELGKAVPGVTGQVLTRSLRALERDGIVVRRYFPQVPPCVEYGLTDLGVTLCEPVGAIRAWAEKYGEAILTARQRYERNRSAGPGDATPR